MNKMTNEEINFYRVLKTMYKNLENQKNFQKLRADFKKLFDGHLSQAVLVTRIIDAICVGYNLNIQEKTWYIDNCFLPFEGQKVEETAVITDNDLSLDENETMPESFSEFVFGEFMSRLFVNIYGTLYFQINSIGFYKISNNAQQINKSFWGVRFTFPLNRIIVEHPQLSCLKNILLHPSKTNNLQNRTIPIWTEKGKFWNTSKCQDLINLIINARNCFKNVEFKTYNKAAVIYNFYNKDDKFSNLLTRLTFESGEVKLNPSSKLLTQNELMSYISAVSHNQLLYRCNDINCCEIWLPLDTNKDKINSNAIYGFLEYFTQGDKELFDKLAVDFCYLIMNPKYSQSNTIVTGYIEKFDKWLEQILSFISVIYPFGFPLGGQNPNYNPQYDPHYDLCKNPRFHPYHEIYDIRNSNPYFLQSAMDGFNVYTDNQGKPTQIPRCHKYLKLPRNVRNDDFSMRSDYITLDFHEGGDFYSMKALTREEMTWVYKMLFAHGLNKLNKAPSSGKNKIKNTNVEQDFITKYLTIEENDGIRLPLALLYVLYTAYSKSVRVGAAVSSSELRKMLENNGYTYDTQKIRKSAEIPYLQNSIIPFMKDLNIPFEDKWFDSAKTCKVVCCKINESLWKQLNVTETPVEVKEENEKFRQYIKKLEEKYMTYFSFTKEESEKKQEDDYVDIETKFKNV